MFLFYYLLFIALLKDQVAERLRQGDSEGMYEMVLVEQAGPNRSFSAKTNANQVLIYDCLLGCSLASIHVPTTLLYVSPWPWSVQTPTQEQAGALPWAALEESTKRQIKRTLQLLVHRGSFTSIDFWSSREEKEKDNVSREK